MTYTIDEGHPLYPLLQPVLEELRKQGEDRAALAQELSAAQKVAEDLRSQLAAANTAIAAANAVVSVANAKISTLNQQITQLKALPKAPEAWELTARDIIAGGKALGKFNIPYAFGGDSFQEGGLDCSGFTKLLFDLFAGTDLHRVSGDQASQGTAVPVTKLRPGDVLFFTYSQRNEGEPTHVGIYLGGGKMLHTNNDSERIHVSTVNMSTVTAARRLF